MVEGRVDPESEGPVDDSEGAVDDPEMGVMGERNRSTGGVQDRPLHQTGWPHHQTHLQTHHLRRCTLTEWGRGCADVLYLQQ